MKVVQSVFISDNPKKERNMSNGFSFGENNSDFVYDNKLGQMLTAMERLAEIQKEVLEEIRNLRTDIKDIAMTWRENDRDRRY